MAECVDCNCKKVPVGYDNCARLQDANDEQILCAINAIQTTEDYTTLPKKMAKVLYQFWCLFKNIIAQICWIVTELKRLCQTLSCLNKRIDDLQKSILATMIDNVAFGISARTGGGGSVTGGNVYMKSTVDQKNRTFKFFWNMVDSSGEAGKGELNGKVDAEYKANEDGTVTVNIKSYTITNLSYKASRAGSSSANIKVSDAKGSVIANQTYNPYSSWTKQVNKTVPIGKVLTLQPKQSTGDIELFNIQDTWQFAPTNGTAYAKYDNNNDKLPNFTGACPIDCPS